MESPGFGVGMYSPEEVSRIVGLGAGRVQRWFRDLSLRDDGGARKPLLDADWPEIDGAVTLSFLDMVEARFVKVFLDLGLSLSTIRAASREGTALFETRHPFCSRRFETDGVSLFVRVLDQDGKERLVDVPFRQNAIAEVMNPILKQLDYDENGAAQRWWPLGKERPVVLDPRRSFGEPIVAEHGVPTRSLAGPVLAGDDPSLVSRWFGVDRAEVDAAVEYERRLLAAA